MVTASPEDRTQVEIVDDRVNSGQVELPEGQALWSERADAARLSGSFRSRQHASLLRLIEALPLHQPAPDAQKPQVVVVDPDQTTRTVIARALADAGCEVVAALRSGVGATYAVRTLEPTVVVTELDLRPAGVWSGLLLLASLAKDAPAVRVLVVTRPELAHLAGLAVRAGAQQMLPKSDIRGLVEAVRAADP